jgi:hypothetical protein
LLRKLLPISAAVNQPANQAMCSVEPRKGELGFWELGFQRYSDLPGIWSSPMDESVRMADLGFGIYGHDGHTMSDEPVNMETKAEAESPVVCPVCGAVAVQEKCKLICRSDVCRGRVVMNCSEF